MRAYCCFGIVLFITVDMITSSIPNKTIHEVNNKLKTVETRRKNKKSMSTSSDSLDRKSDESEGSQVSLGISSQSSTSSSESRGGFKPKSSEQRRGWRKWHRKCPPCPDDMVKKWRDKSIDWICGGYQRARRSFKSDCMMHYRNCQDGTMFVKIHDRRCENDTGSGPRRGFHFFYEYGKDSQDSKKSDVSSSSAHISSEFMSST